MRKVILIVSLFFFQVAQAQIVNIPDVNFKNALVNEPVWDLDCDGKFMIPVDTNNDGEIQLSEAEAVTCLIVSGYNISSMQGIEGFSNVQVLYCTNNQITDIDISQNLALLVLDCQSNQIDVLDVSSNSNLDRLLCYDNRLTQLDVSQNSLLRTLSCSINQLTSIDVSQNPLLWIFHCNINQIESLDVSQNPDLVSLLCYDNQLTFLNIKNGNNTALAFFRAEENPNLSCIQVDDEVYANNAPWSKDPWTEYSEDCILGVNRIEKLQAVIYPNPVSETLFIKSQEVIESIQVYSMLGKLIASERNTNQIDFSKYPAGVYFVKIEAETGYSFQKVLKE